MTLPIGSLALIFFFPISPLRNIKLSEYSGDLVRGKNLSWGQMSKSVGETSNWAKSYKRNQMLNEVGHRLRLFPSEGTRQISHAETLRLSNDSFCLFRGENKTTSWDCCRLLFVLLGYFKTDLAETKPTQVYSQSSHTQSGAVVAYGWEEQGGGDQHKAERERERKLSSA